MAGDKGVDCGSTSQAVVALNNKSSFPRRRIIGPPRNEE